MQDAIALQDNQIQNKIYTVRGLQVMMDRDLASASAIRRFSAGGSLGLIDGGPWFPATACPPLTESMSIWIRARAYSPGNEKNYDPSETVHGVSELVQAIETDSS